MTIEIKDDEATITLATQLVVAVRELRQAAEAYRLAVMGQPTQQAEQKQTFTIQSSAQAWLCVVAVVAALVWGLSKDGEKSDTLVSLQAQVTRQQGEIMDLRADIRELRATDNAVRAYINTGILKPKTTEKTK